MPILKKNKWLCSFICFSSAWLAAQPRESVAVHGNARLQEVSKGHLHVHTGDKAIIEWKSFSIAPGEVTQFIQPSATSAVLNRVTSGIKSEILGHLKSNGRVYLINRAGILPGKDSFVQTS